LFDFFFTDAREAGEFIPVGIVTDLTVGVDTLSVLIDKGYIEGVTLEEFLAEGAE